MDRSYRRFSGVRWATVFVVICQLLATKVASLSTADVFETPQSSILLVTMGGTRSHKIPFLALADGLIAKGHRVTLVSGYSPSGSHPGLEEVVPERFRQDVAAFEDYDYLGTRIRNEVVTNLRDAFRAATTFCDGFLSDASIKALLHRHFDLVIIDSYYAECAIGLVPILKAPFVFLNTMTNYLNNLVFSGNPAPWSITPFFAKPYTSEMSFGQRLQNGALHFVIDALQRFVAFHIHQLQKRHLRRDIPHPLELAQNVSFVLQNGHVTVSHSHPFLPNVAQIACLQCAPPKPLPAHLQEYVEGAGEEGFVYVSMGTSVNPKTLPPELLRVIVTAFSQLPYRILWKFDANIGDLQLPPNVRIEQWLPQQDVLGHPNIRAFVTHSGMFGTQEIVYHGVPVVTLPVFADQDSNAMKVVQEGYGIQLELKHLTVQQLVAAVNAVATDPKYRAAVRRAQRILRDQPMTPLDTAIYWTEYVLRHQGAPQFQSAGRHLNWVQYYGYDLALFCVALCWGVWMLIKRTRILISRSSSAGDAKKVKQW